LGVKQTSLPHRKMSAYDPKQTSVLRLVGLQRRDFSEVVEGRILDTRSSC